MPGGQEPSEDRDAFLLGLAASLLGLAPAQGSSLLFVRGGGRLWWLGIKKQAERFS